MNATCHAARPRRRRQRVWNHPTKSGSPTHALRCVYDDWNLIASLDPQPSVLIKTMKCFPAIVFTVLLSFVLGCEPDEQYHARILGGQLRTLYEKWQSQGRPVGFEITNHYYVMHTTNQAFFLTNTVSVEGARYTCRLAIRDPSRFRPSGLLVLTDQGVLLWLGDDGKVVVSPDINGLRSN
jgi:hypothetical protein